jgi:hypothetical protein
MNSVRSCGCMQPHDRTEFFITLAKHGSKLHDDGLLTETCSSILM